MMLKVSGESEQYDIKKDVVSKVSNKWTVSVIDNGVYLRLTNGKDKVTLYIKEIFVVLKAYQGCTIKRRDGGAFTFYDEGTINVVI